MALPNRSRREVMKLSRTQSPFEQVGASAFIEASQRNSDHEFRN